MFDTHCHFDSVDIAKSQLVDAYGSGLRAINVIGCDVETTRRALDVVKMINENREYLGLDDLDIQATMGLHPHEAQYLNDQRNELEKLLNENNEIISGVGETGFDFYYNHSTKQDQLEAFLWQIELAKSANKALVIHTRDAWEDTFNTLKKCGWPSKVVMHCFTGGPDQALHCVSNGAYISISGIATFKNAQEIKDAIAVVPLDKLLCETDAPWLAPVPHRGKDNEPSYVSFVIDEIVKIRNEQCGEDREEVVNALFRNGLTLFR